MSDNLPECFDNGSNADEQEALIQRCEKWLLEDSQPLALQDKQVTSFSMKKLHERLGSPDKQFRQWARKKRRALQLQEGVDVTISSLPDSKPGRPEVDYLLTFEAARLVLSSTRTPLGNAMLRALLRISDKIARGDVGVATIIARNMPNPQPSGAPFTDACNFSDVCLWHSARPPTAGTDLVQ